MAHPEPNGRDRITLRDHVVEADIGAYQGERGRRQRLRFSIEVEVLRATEEDDVDRIVSYDLLVDAVSESLSRERLNLLETLAERIASRVLQPAAALAARVAVEKLDIVPGALGVRIERRRDEVHPATEPAVRPQVFYLGNSAVEAAGLAPWLDERDGTPAILCVGAPELSRPAARNASAQRRIDLLAIGQNAWVLAARDRRCVVRETRAELEWAARRMLPSVWAPAKLALDLEGAPEADGALLAAWLARVLDAERLVYVSADPPPGVEGEREILR